MPNGARLVCSAVGVYEPAKVAAVLPHVDVAVINYGLHYHTRDNFVDVLSQLFAQLKSWADARAGRVPLYRENSAQHFRGGAWRPGAHKPPPGTPCACERLDARAAIDRSERAAANQNIEFNTLAAQMGAQHGVRLVPFFNLTAPRFDMHRRHFCSYSNQLKVGRCCDCTHLCYTPLLWDNYFELLGSAMLASPRWAGAAAAAAAETVEANDDGSSGASASVRAQLAQALARRVARHTGGARRGNWRGGGGARGRRGGGVGAMGGATRRRAARGAWRAGSLPF